MLAKLTAKNRPEEIVQQFPGIEHFEVMTDGNAVILKAFSQNSLEKIRAHIERLGITEQDVADAVKWARSQE
jgi:hypothetical protein